MKIHNIFAAIAVFLPIAAAAQNLDPTVEVSRTYEGKLMEAHKPQLEMAVPDSVLHFDLDFDYSVTDKPYKGSYEFSPYTVEMRPSPTVHDRDTFYLKAGAGYSLHPEFDLIWSPNFKKPFRMNLYIDHDSYVGRYWNLAEPASVDGEIVLNRLPKSARDGRTWKGYDFKTRAGVEGRYDWEKGLFRFDVGYQGLQQDYDQADMVNRFYDALDVKLGLSSKKSSGFIYSGGLNYLLSYDKITILQYTQEYGGGMEQHASEFGLNASLGYVREKGDRFLLDLGVDVASMSGEYFNDAFDLDIVPHYVLNLDRWNFDIGLRLSFAPHFDFGTDVSRVTSQSVYPDVRVEYMAVRDALKVYLDLGGDARVNSYSDVLAFNRFVNPAYGHLSWPVMNVTDEIINAVLGMEGRIGPHFSFGFKGGYVKYEDVLMEGLYMIKGQPDFGIPARLFPGIGYGVYDKAYLALDWLLDTESLRFDGNVEYSYSYSPQKPRNLEGLFMPAALRGDAALTYDWKDRVFVGFDCDFSTARKGSVQHPADDASGLVGTPARIPGYADLGINMEYVVNRKFSVWARGGNLLGMTVQRNILYAEKGPYFTAGICLNL